MLPSALKAIAGALGPKCTLSHRCRCMGQRRTRPRKRRRTHCCRSRPRHRRHTQRSREPRPEGRRPPGQGARGGAVRGSRREIFGCPLLPLGTDPLRLEELLDGEVQLTGRGAQRLADRLNPEAGVRLDVLAELLGELRQLARGRFSPAARLGAAAFLEAGAFGAGPALAAGAGLVALAAGTLAAGAGAAALRGRPRPRLAATGAGAATGLSPPRAADAASRADCLIRRVRLATKASVLERISSAAFDIQNRIARHLWRCQPLMSALTRNWQSTFRRGRHPRSSTSTPRCGEMPACQAGRRRGVDHPSSRYTRGTPWVVGAQSLPCLHAHPATLANP